MNQGKIKITVGIDVSKAKLDIGYLPLNEYFIIKNNPRAIGQWLTKMNTLYEVDTVALEPTGGYEKLLVKQLVEAGITTYLVHPNQLVHFRKSKSSGQAKTDKLAAKELAQYSKQYANNLTAVSEDYKEKQALKELSRRIEQLKKLIHSERNRLEKCCSINRWHKPLNVLFAL